MADAMFGTKFGGEPMTAEEKCGAYTPEHLVDWMIKYHELPENSRETVLSNIRSAFQAERAVGFIAGRAQTVPKIEMHFSLFGRKQ